MLRNLIQALSVLILAILPLAGCQPQGTNPNNFPAKEASQRMISKRLVIFAAASLSEAFTEIGSEFDNTHTGMKTIFNFAGSQQLAQQLAQGAPADVFASADKEQMEAAIRMNRVNPNDMQAFISNRLVVVLPVDNPAHLQNLKDLSRPGVKLVVAAEAVPVGLYSLEFFNNASQDPAYGSDFKDKVVANIVSYEENVKAVLSKVILGEADAGIVYTSDITTASAAEVLTLAIPNRLNIMASYFIAPINDSHQEELGRQFLAFVVSREGQDILMKNGFNPLQMP